MACLSLMSLFCHFSVNTLIILSLFCYYSVISLSLFCQYYMWLFFHHSVIILSYSCHFYSCFSIYDEYKKTYLNVRWINVCWWTMTQVKKFDNICINNVSVFIFGSTESIYKTSFSYPFNISTRKGKFLIITYISRIFSRINISNGNLQPFITFRASALVNVPQLTTSAWWKYSPRRSSSSHILFFSTVKHTALKK